MEHSLISDIRVASPLEMRIMAVRFLAVPLRSVHAATISAAQMMPFEDNSIAGKSAGDDAEAVSPRSMRAAAEAFSARPNCVDSASLSYGVSNGLPNRVAGSPNFITFVPPVERGLAARAAIRSSRRSGHTPRSGTTSKSQPTSDDARSNSFFAGSSRVCANGKSITRRSPERRSALPSFLISAPFPKTI